MNKARRETEELQSRYNEQSSKVKELEQSLKFYKDDNIYRRDLRHKRMVRDLRQKLKAAGKNEEVLSGRLVNLLEKKERLVESVNKKKEEVDKL